MTASAMSGPTLTVDRPEPGQVSRTALIAALDRLAAVGRAVTEMRREQQPVNATQQPEAPVDGSGQPMATAPACERGTAA